MPFLPLPVMMSDTKKKKMKLGKPHKPKGWRLESTRHSLARKGIKTGRKSRMQKIFNKFNKASDIATKYQLKLEKEQEHSYIARGMWGAGAIGGGFLGLVSGVAITGVPTVGMAGLITGGMAGGTLAMKAYTKLPKKVKGILRVNVRKERYYAKHPRPMMGIPLPKKTEKKWEKAIEDFHIPYEKELGKAGDKFFTTAFGWYIKASEESGIDFRKSEGELGKDMSAALQFWKKKKPKKKRKKVKVDPKTLFKTIPLAQVKAKELRKKGFETQIFRKGELFQVGFRKKKVE